jgi:molybdopterin-guanine dinucleotide biosynthesis protein A
MGRDKALLDFGGVPLILRTSRLIESLVGEVTIIGSPSRYAALGLRVIPDIEGTQSGAGKPGGGPLAGIATALAVSHSRWNLIVACDLPYLSAKWLDWLLSRAVHSRAHAIVPLTDRGIDPLASVYRRECVAPIAAAMARGIRKVSDVVEELPVEFVYPSEWRRVDPGELVLKNMNAPGDYEKARKWWETTSLRENEHVRRSQRTPERKRRSAPRRRK